nr:putative integron gene cassette protein [uncultured bacterium]
MERLVRPLTPRSLPAQPECGNRVDHASLSPGGGITGLSYAGAWARVDQRSS